MLGAGGDSLKIGVGGGVSILFGAGSIDLNSINSGTITSIKPEIAPIATPQGVFKIPLSEFWGSITEG